MLKRNYERIEINQDGNYVGGKKIKNNSVLLIKYPNGLERIYRASRVKLENEMEVILLDGS